MPCQRCVERGRPANFGSEPRCAFESGEFSPDNWNCATANEIRVLMGEGWDDDLRTPENFYVRRDDASYGALWVPPNPNDVPDGDDVGPWRGGGLIAGYWYKHRGTIDGLFRVDPRDGGRTEEAGQPLTLREAEAAIVNCRLKLPTSRLLSRVRRSK